MDMDYIKGWKQCSINHIFPMRPSHLVISMYFNHP